MPIKVLVGERYLSGGTGLFAVAEWLLGGVGSWCELGLVGFTKGVRTRKGIFKPFAACLSGSLTGEGAVLVPRGRGAGFREPGGA